MKGYTVWIMLFGVILSSCSSIPGKVPIDEKKTDLYVSSQEVHQRIFSECDQFIQELNAIIANRQYALWTEHLTKVYIQTFSSPEYLHEISQFPILKDRGIVLKSLQDYFHNVVVPSRSNAVLDEIVILKQHQVIAYSIYKGKRAKLYELESLNEAWKITVW